MISTTDYGRKIEIWAADWFVTNRRARIVERNFRRRTGEIDLILEETSASGVELVFVEVRARLNRKVSGLESVDFKKQLKLRRTIDLFLQRYRGKAKSMRVDVLAWDGKEFSHFPNLRLCANNR